MDLPGLAAALSKAPAAAEKAAGTVVRRAARHLRDDAKSLVQSQISGVYLPHYAASITMEMDGMLAAIIGPDSGRQQGGMGRGVEFGSAKHGPIPHMIPAADNAEKAFGDDLLAAVARAAL